jgi:ABC-type phosphate/phosphonate transport system substrate-binding protein
MWLRKASVLGGPAALACALAVGLPAAPEAAGREAGGVLRVGTSGLLTGDATKGDKEKTALETLKSFIRDETGMGNEIVREKSWQALVDQLAAGKVQVGVFKGSEFAWAQGSHPKLKPLALAADLYVLRTAYVVTQKTNPASDFAGLKGKALAVPATGEDYTQLFAEGLARKAGQPLDKLFSKVTHPANVEDAIDDVVDGVVGATVVDRAALEAFKARKPGRFRRLKRVAQSEPFPPAVIAYYGNGLEASRREKFQRGLLNASQNEKGKLMLALFHLTGFAKPPADFDAVLARVRKDYPPEKHVAAK